MENTAKTGIEIIFQIIRMVIPLVISWAVVRVVLRSMSRERLKGNLALTLLRSVLVALIWAIGIFASMGQIDAFTKTWETVLASTSVAGVVFGHGWLLSVRIIYVVARKSISCGNCISKNTIYCERLKC